MTTVLLGALSAMVFAGAAWSGVLAGKTLCDNRTPHADGPRPVAFPVWPFPLAGAAIGLVTGLHGDPPVRLAMLAFAVFALAGCTATDLTCGILPDLLTLAPLSLAIGTGLVAHDLMPAFGAAVVALPFAATALLTHGRGMGWGDVKLAALGGALLGARDATLAFTLAGFAAYIVTRRGARSREPIAFGPYLACSIATMLAALPGG